jgi:ABC-type multidrug transport system ATPase subunit
LSLFASETPPPISDTGTTVHTDRGVARDGAEGAGEVSFSWPGSLAGYLPAALRALAREKEALGVAGYGLAAPSLDGVFKAVLEENETSAASDEKRTAVREPRRDVDIDVDENAFEREPSRSRVGVFSATVVAVFFASFRAFRRDRARLVATFVAPTFLLLAASAMAAFRATPSTYAASFHVPVVSSGSPEALPLAFLSDCAVVPFGFGAHDESYVHTKLDTAFKTRASFETVFVEPLNKSGSTLPQSGATCFPEEALWRAFKQRVPSSLNPRRARDSVGVAAGAGGDSADAATVWWSSERVRRAAAAAVTRTRALERFDSAFGGGGGASEIAKQVAAAAADAADAAGAFRPWPKTDDQTRRALLASTPGPAAAAAAALLAVSVPPCLAAAAAAKQRASGLRRVLLVAGAPKLAHWLGVVLADLFVLVPATLAHVLAFCVAGGDALLGDGWVRLPDAFALFYAHALASLAAAHLVAVAIGEESAHKAFPSCLLLGATPATALAGVTYALDALGNVAGAETVFSVARVFPGFAVAQGTLELALSSALAFETASTAERGKAFEMARDETRDGKRLMASYVSRGGGVDGLVAASLVVCLVAVALVFLLDGASVTARAFLERCVSSEADIRRAVEAEGERDADVVAEETRLRDLARSRSSQTGLKTADPDVETGVAKKTLDEPTDALRVFGLRKSYLGGASSRPAVRDLWLGVKPGECFGLLGINGCGKTTTFRMAAGDLPPTAGCVEIGNEGHERTRRKNGGAVGYCPQKDAIVRSLTVTEHLRLVAAARGTLFLAPDADVSIRRAVDAAGLGAFAQTRAGSLSGGNKRKLCLAMALFGLRRNGLALLDEPTAGVDPGAREQITEMIRDAAKSRRCACVVTSHAVEDVAALCHRVGVMVDGAMLCLGAPQHLRTKHGKHLTLTVHAEARAEREEEETVSAKSLLGRKSSLDLDATVREAAPGATRVGAFGDGETSDAKSSGAAQKAARAFGFIEGASEADDAALSEAKRVAARGAAESENADNASRTWELPASADLPSVLEALERLRADDESGIEGYAVGQASLEDVFLEFASRGAAQSDAQMMAMEDALHAHRLALAKK